MDSLASLNIIPFLGLMNILEVKYLHMPEVYRTMLAILCDYNPLFQSNIIRTRRYLKVLLAREPDLAQCLLNFMDEPQENTQTSTHSGAAGSRSPSSDANRDSPPKPTRSATLVYPELELQTRSTLAGSPPSSVPVQHIADPCQSSDKTDVDASAIAADYKGCLINIETMSGAAVKATDFPLNIFQMNVAAKTSSSPTVTSAAGSHHGDPLKSQPPPPSYGADRMPHFVPVINIHHRGVVLASGEDTAIAGNSACPSAASAEPLPPPPQSPAPDSVPLFLPRLLSSPIVPAAVPAGGVGLAGQQALLPAAGGVAASAAMSDAEQRSSTTAAAAALALQQLGSQVPAQTDSVAALSSASAKSRPSLKSGRKCRVAQTQTSATDLPTVSSKAHGAVTAARETPNTVRTPSVLQTTTINTTTTTTNSNTTNTSLTKNTLSVPTTTTTTTASSQASSTSTPNMCLSKLLGQPSVSYHLPAGQFIDNRNCIVGGGGGGGGGGRPKPASASAEKEGLYGSAGAMSVGGKVSSAAAKLRLLSTQAGGDNKAAGSTRRAGYGGGAGLKAATTTVTAKLGSLSVQTPAAEQRREIRSTTTTTTVLKFSSCSPSSSSSKSGESGASKTLALSKILPVPKLVAAAAAAAASTTPGQKADTVSFDKQVQVGQRQVSKKPKTPAAHSSRQPGGQASSGSRQHVQEPPWNPRRDWQKSSAAKHQQQQQGAETEPPASRDEGRDSQVVGQRAHKNQSTRQQETTTKLPRPGQYQESQKPPLTTVTLSGGGGKPLSGKAVASSSSSAAAGGGTAGRHKVHVVEVSLGTTHSLSTFPYIQQILLPDGQVSTIAHNSPGEGQACAAATHKTPPPEPSQSTKASSTTTTTTTSSSLSSLSSSSLGKPPASTGSLHAGKAPATKPTVTSVLPHSQVQLSVSIQTSSAKLGSNTAGKKRKLAAGACPLPGSSPPGLPAVEATRSPPATTLLSTGRAETGAEEAERGEGKVPGHHAAALMGVPQALPEAPAAGGSRGGKGKRKRSATSCAARPAVKKCNKENIAA